MAVQLRSRNSPSDPADAPPLASTYQYAPRFLLYTDSLATRSLDQLAVHIRELLPSSLRAGWRLLCSGHLHHSSQERTAIRVARWLSLHGPAAGFRIPTVVERARGYGMESYLLGFGLSERALFDAEGNMFDPDCWLQRVSAALWAWCCGLADLPSANPPSLADVAASYVSLSDWVAAQGQQPCSSYVPSDLGDLASSLLRWSPLSLPVSMVGATASGRVGPPRALSRRAARPRAASPTLAAACRVAP